MRDRRYLAIGDRNTDLMIRCCYNSHKSIISGAKRIYVPKSSFVFLHLNQLYLRRVFSDE